MQISNVMIAKFNKLYILCNMSFCYALLILSAVKTRYRLTNQKNEIYKLINQRMLQSHLTSR